MKKKLPIILLGVILACVLVFGFLYANNDIGKTANSLEADIRQSQKILDDWIVDGSISDTMAAFISYPQDKTDHTFSVYVNRPGLSFGYFFRGGGDIVEVDDYIAEFVVEGNNERAFISMNTQNIVRLEVDDGNGIQVIDIDSGKPFAIVLPLNVGNICFYDTNGNVVEYAFAGLSVQEQSILILHFVLDLPDQEVGRLVGMSRSAVQRRRAKSLTELRIKLAALMPKGG